MDDFGPLHGYDASSHLRHPDAFGVGTGRSADGVPTIELTTDPKVQGAHGRVHVRRGSERRRGLFADVRRGDEARATCQSDDSIRVFGRFAPEVELIVGSDAAVRLVARTPAGAVLAGPVTFAVDAPPTALVW
jgi:hypothetical protein